MIWINVILVVAVLITIIKIMTIIIIKWEQKCVWLFYCFYFKKNYDNLMSKSPCFFWTKIPKLDGVEDETSLTQSWRDKPCASAPKRIAN